MNIVQRLYPQNPHNHEAETEELVKVQAEAPKVEKPKKKRTRKSTKKEN